MIEHDVEDDFYTVVMEGFDHFFQFQSFPVIFHRRAVARVWCEEADRIVSPIVQKTAAVNDTGVPHLVKFKDRHQLHSINSQFLQIGNLFLQTVKSAGTADAGRIVFCETPHMEFIDHQVFHRDLDMAFRAPVKIRVYHPGAVTVGSTVLLSPPALAGDSLCIRIQKDF